MNQGSLSTKRAGPLASSLEAKRSRGKALLLPTCFGFLQLTCVYFNVAATVVVIRIQLLWPSNVN